MAESVINGTDLYCFIEGVAIAHATNHTLSIKTAVIPTSNKDTGLYATKIPGRSDVTVTCEGFIAYGDFETVVNAKIARLPVTLTLGKKSSGALVTSQPYFTGEFIITSYELSAADNTIATYNVTFDHYESFQFVTSFIPNDNWLARWDFNGNALDTSGNGNYLSNTDATLTTDRNSGINKAYDFDGTSAAMYRTRIPITNNVFSLAMWFNTDNWNATIDLLFGNFQVGSGNGFAIITVPTDLRFWVGKFDTVAADSNHLNIAYPTTGGWHFICAMYSKALGKMYFSMDDGVLNEASVDYDLEANAALTPDITLGYLATYYFDGKMDQIYFYNRILTPIEITALYNYSL